MRSSRLPPSRGGRLGPSGSTPSRRGGRRKRKSACGSRTNSCRRSSNGCRRSSNCRDGKVEKKKEGGNNKKNGSRSCWNNTGSKIC